MSAVLIIISAGCSRDENNGESDAVVFNPNSIVGTWELAALCYPANEFELPLNYPSGLELPLEYRDVFIFDSNGKLMVTKSRSSIFDDWPNEDGEYEYFYDEEQQIIEFCEKKRECIIMDGKMVIESGYSSAYREPIQFFIFVKKQI